MLASFPQVTGQETCYTFVDADWYPWKRHECQCPSIDIFKGKITAKILRLRFLLQIIKRLAQQFRRIILLRFGLVAFRFHSGRTRKLFIFMLSDLADVTMTPKTSIMYL